MELIGSIANQGTLQGQINDANGYLTGVITNAGLLGGQVVAERGLKGDKGETGATGATGNGISSVTYVSSSGLVDTYKITFTNGTETTFGVTNGQDGSDGQDGADGYSPSASVSKTDNKATITITDKDGTTTADVYDGSGIPSGGTMGQVLTKDSGTDYDVSWEDPSGGTITDVTVDGTSIVDDGVAELDTVTQLRDGLMTALDKQKLDGVASGAEVNVNADWDAVSGDAQILNKPTIPSKTSDLNNDSGFITGMTILSYGNSTWQNFIDAYNANKVVYCRASSNANPASGSQTRLAFMAYVNNATTPTEVEFQYYRSVSSHSASQQGDQVFVYKLNSAGTWSVTTREASSKIVAGTNMSSSYSSGVLTLTSSGEANVQSDWSQSDTTADDYIKNKPTIPTKVSELNNDSGFITGVTSTSTPTASTIAEFDSSSYINSTDMTSSEVEDFVDELDVGGGGILDMFYPVGSYYETSDSTFDPNVRWGGTWVLEAEGQVHISAGTNYTVNGALTNASDGGEATHLLTVDEMPSHNHSFSRWGDGTHYYPSSGTILKWYSSAYNTQTVTVSDKGGGLAHNNMQPYIIVNRWHRTA